MNSAIWQELKGEHTYKFQEHGKELIEKVKRKNGGHKLQKVGIQMERIW